MTLICRRIRPLQKDVAALAAYVLIAAVYTWPLLGRAGDHIASDAGDPILNTSILWWNATVVPFTAAWWTPPFFFPSVNVAAFTENLVGLGVDSDTDLLGDRSADPDLQPHPLPDVAD